MKLAFVTNLCTHYRVKTYEILARKMDTDFFFFSAGEEWYWQQRLGVKTGDFHHQYLPGFQLGRTRITPTLPWKLMKGNYDVYLKCINGRFALPMTYWVARLKQKPFILWTGVWMRLGTPAHRLFYPVTRYIYQHADAIVGYGEHVRRFLVSEGVPSERLFIAPHAIDNDQYNQPIPNEKKEAFRLAINAADTQKIVLYLGRLEPVKGLPNLLEAFARIENNNSLLVLAGAGSEEENLINLAKRLHLLPRIRFLGYISPEQTPTLFSAAWVFVLPSITLPTGRETWGLVINEAFNQSVPVIASDAVGAAAGGFVKDGFNGIIVPEQNSRELSIALQKVLGDEILRGRLSNAARQTVEQWDNERMVSGFLEAIRYVVR